MGNRVSGSNNVAIGPDAQYNSIGSNYNVSVGSFAGYNITTGQSNIFIGNKAGYANKTQGFSDSNRLRSYGWRCWNK